VVRVDDEVVKRSTFDHWLRVAAMASQQPGTAQAASVPDAPDFKRCIAGKRRTLPKPARGQQPVSDTQLKSQCNQEYGQLRDQVLQFLIQAEWLQGEARDQDIEVSQKEINTSFQRQKKQSFPTDAEYKNFLKTSGMSQQDIFLRVKLDLVSDKIRKKVTEEEGKVTDKQISDYYAKNKKRFAQPERRDLQVVLTKTAARAQAARRALGQGQAFPAVVRRFSVDQASKRNRGGLVGVIPGQQEKALDKAAFAARLNQIGGPVKTPFGYYIFRVNKITPARQQTEKQVEGTIRQLLKSQNEQKALNDFVKKFQKKWKDRTNCRKGFIIDTCKNAPKPKTNTTPPGAVPQQGAPPQGAPQGAPQQGVPPQGAPPQGAPPQGAPPQGAPPQGAPPQGAPPQGAPPQQGAPPPQP